MCTVRYRLNTPLEHYLITLISLILFHKYQASLSLRGLKILTKKRGKKEKNLRFDPKMTLGGHPPNFDQNNSYLLIFLLASFLPHFLHGGRELRRENREETLPFQS